MPISSSRVPVPRPPGTKKKEIFSQDEYSEIDAHALKFDHNLLFRGTKALVEYLITPAKSELGRVRAVFTWLTMADVDLLQHTDRIPAVDSPYACLKRIGEKKSTHTIFFHALCEAANIHCVKVRGIAKNARYQVGSEIDEVRLCSQWNAVVIDGKWRLIDALWASRTVPKSGQDGGSNAKTSNQTVTCRTNEFFFLTDPELFIYTHFPDNSKWQLLHKKVSLEDFERMPYLRERFFEMGLGLVEDSFKSVVIETLNGEAFIVFTVDTNTTNNEFRHLLQAPKKTKTNSTAGLSNGPAMNLDDAVTVIKHPGELRFHLLLPEHGRYRFDVFGRNVTKTSLQAFDLLCTYIVEYKLDGDSCFEVRFFFKEPSEYARYLRRGGASNWLKKKEATLKIIRHEMILSIATPPGPNPAKHFVEDYDNSQHLVPPILRSLLYIMPDEVNLCEAHDIPNGPADWKIGNMQISFLSHVNGLVRTADGKADIRIRASENAEMWYDFHEANRTRGVPEAAVAVGFRKEIEGTIFTFALTLNRPFNYLLTLFARARGVQNKFFHAKSYRIEYELLDCV